MSIDSSELGRSAKSWRDWLSEKHPVLAEQVNAGASEKEINRLREHFSDRLPEAVFAFYRSMNGQSDLDLPILLNGYVLLSADDVIRVWKNIKAVNDQMKSKVNLKLENDYGSVKGYISNLNWIPIAENIGGDVLCIDLDPTDEGRYGQIISVVHDDIDLRVLAGSFAEFIEGYVSDLTSGKVVYLEDYRSFVDPNDEDYLARNGITLSEG